MTQPFIGSITAFAGNFAPRGWAFCDGQLLSVSQNDALFSLLGTIYGGDGRTTFGLPDLRGRIPIHAGSGPGLTPRNLGAKLGSERVTVGANQLPSHTHELRASDDTNVGADPGGAVPGHPAKNVYRSPFGTPNFDLDPASLTAAGGSQPHDNLMPTVCVNFIIALTGIYPSRD